MRKFALMLLAVVTAYSLTSCHHHHHDDPWDQGGTVSITVNGTTFSADHAYWSAEILNTNETWYTLSLYNCSYPNVTDPWLSISIVYHVVNGSTSAPATGSFTNFQVSLSKTCSDDSQDRWYYAFGNEGGNNTTLNISKNGNKYNVQCGAMKYIDGFATSNTYPGGAFSYSGTFSPHPVPANK